MSLSVIFPGQGSQKVGMGKEMFESFPIAKEVFQEVDDALNMNLSNIIFDGPQADLTLTINAQPALMTVSIAIVKVLENLLNKNLHDFVDFVAGHSLGEYTALVAGRSLVLSDAAKILKLRGKAMQEAVPLGRGAMAAIIGSDIPTIGELIKISAKQDEILEIANDNAPGQIVISGHSSAIERSLENIKVMGIRKALQLPVSAPFHCSLMQPALKEMSNPIKALSIVAPKITLCNNIDADFLTDSEKIKNSLIKQITGRVRWRESIEKLRDNGKVSKFVELGAGSVLSGLIKRIDGDLETSSLESIQDIENFAKLL